MKNLMMLIFCCLIGLQLNANHISEQPMHNVVANSGLTLRMFPGTHGAAIKVIPFGEQVTVIDNTDEHPDRVDWVDGHWVMVTHDGDTGYVFNGFLSELAIPEYDFEVSQFELDLIYPLESYAEYRFNADGEADTIHSTKRTKVIQKFEHGEKMIKTSNGDYYKTQLFLNDIRIMDAYHLVLQMVQEKSNQEVFKNESVFIQGRSGEIETIKVKLDNPIDIRKLSNGQIRISILTSESGCEL